MPFAGNEVGGQPTAGFEKVGHVTFLSRHAVFPRDRSSAERRSLSALGRPWLHAAACLPRTERPSPAAGEPGPHRRPSTDMKDTTATR
ncbi:hypothetical protein AAFF_G00217850 [Aldrovandia affinis]|uniref:Uncharacterized protein n=1 Tax=Aldrovandia affinis TaxID=143900 RepID=A0AAD7SVW7_9TELE|nr:hypothetical protein AAFF_G00217850 [Aldrovandia affinis]